MDKRKLLEDKFLIEQAITGNTSAEQFNEVLDRANTDLEFRELFRQSASEHNWIEVRVIEANRVAEKNFYRGETIKLIEEMNREPELGEDCEKKLEQSLEHQSEQEMDR